MVSGFIGGWLIVARDQDWYYALVPAEMAQGRTPGAGRAALAKTLEGADGNEGLTAFATFLFSHNTGVTILAFGIGFAFGIPTLILFKNGAPEAQQVGLVGKSKLAALLDQHL